MRETSLAPIGMRQRLKLAPMPEANSSRKTASLSSGLRAASEVQPSSLKQAPNPSIDCRGMSVRTITSGMAAIASTASPRRTTHGVDWLVTTHVTSLASLGSDCCIRVLLVVYTAGVIWPKGKIPDKYYYRVQLPKREEPTSRIWSMNVAVAGSIVLYDRFAKSLIKKS